MYRVGSVAALDEGDAIHVAFYSGPQGPMTGPVLPAEAAMAERVLQAPEEPETAPEGVPTGKVMVDAEGNPLRPEDPPSVVQIKALVPGWETLTYYIQGYEHETGKAVVLANDILVIPNALPFVMRQTIAAAEKLDAWQRATVIRGEELSPYDEHRTSKGVAIRGDQHQPLTPFQNVLMSLQVLFCMAYFSRVNDHMDVTEGQGWELLRYGPGQYFKAHVDQVKDNESLVARRLSIISVASMACEGGDLIFPRQGIKVRANGEVLQKQGDEWDVVVPASEGVVVMFPGGPVFPHESTPVEAGFKYTLVSFFK